MSGKARLTPKEAAYCIARAKGLSEAEAYRQAGYKVDGVADKSLRAHACALEAKPLVTAEINRLKRLNDEAGVWTRAEILQRHKIIADEAREAAKTPIYNDNDELIGYRYSPKAAAVEQKSLDAVSRMCGYDAPQKIEASVGAMGIEDYLKTLDKPVY